VSEPGFDYNQAMRSFFHIDDLEITDSRLFLIAGPCVIEEESLTFDIAAEVQALCRELDIGYIFKASFDKANRSSGRSPRGPGLDRGLKILQRIKGELGLPVLSDIHETWQAEPAGKVLSVLQIPAFLCRKTDLLLAAGATGRPVNIKKGQFMAPEDMRRAVAKVNETGNPRVLLTERGSCFGYHNLVVDFRSIPLMADTNCPVVMDATHAVQRPSAAGEVTGGEPRFIPLIASCGVTAGAHGVFLEVHPEPAKALSDSTNALPLAQLRPLLIQLKKVYNACL
jgi:2-dehydro-3-deoxyphosphooctonate aldolase (KDO 8-P synthase)